MGKKRFSQKQKLSVLKSASKLGIKEAARLAEVHYTTVYEWKHQLEALGEEGFLAYKASYPGRGVKEISATQEKGLSGVLSWFTSLPFPRYWVKAVLP